MQNGSVTYDLHKKDGEKFGKSKEKLYLCSKKKNKKR